MLEEKKHQHSKADTQCFPSMTLFSFTLVRFVLFYQAQNREIEHSTFHIDRDYILSAIGLAFKE